MPDRCVRTSAIVTVGSELVDGIALDTNTREIAAALAESGYRVTEAISVPDNAEILSKTFERLTSSHDLVVTTGGLGPTHDDITREAASQALGLPLEEHPGLVARLQAVRDRHIDSQAAAQVMDQGLILYGATVLEPTSGTAPGQVAKTRRGHLVLLPGPPHEMRPMLEAFLVDRSSARRFVELSCVGISESDAQVRTQRVLSGLEHETIDALGFTVLATPGLVRIVLTDKGAGTTALETVASRVSTELGDACFARDGSSLAETVLSLARDTSVRIAVAESCTGGMVGAAITDVEGSSATFLGGITAYANSAKIELLDVDAQVLDDQGAVSADVATQMAIACRRVFEADLAVSVTGIAGPDGGTAARPVGLVWFGIAHAHGAMAIERHLFGDREGVRVRATVTALDMMRRQLLGIEIV